MNNATLIGRLTKDAETRYAQSDSEMAISRFTLAVDRRGSKEQTADFINCIAFGKLGQFFEKYGKKGTKFAIIGHIQTGSYTNKDGFKVYTTDVVVDEAEFAESKTTEAKGFDAINAPIEVEDEGFMNVPEGLADELPFA